jgi:glutathione S-transferase
MASPPQPPTTGKLEVGYWDIRGLCAPLRMMCCYAGADYDPKLYTLQAKEGGGWDASNWFGVKPALKEKNALMNLPYIVDGDVVVSQTNACFAYLGRKFGLYGSNDTEMIQCEQVLCEVMDLRNNAVKFFYSSGDDLAARTTAHAASAEGSFGKLEEWLAQQGTDFFAGASPTAADFHAFEMVDQHACTEVLVASAENFPLLAAFHARFRALPQLQAYFDGPLHKLPLNNRMACVGATADPLAHKKTE